jgi:hypothetical protein
MVTLVNRAKVGTTTTGTGTITLGPAKVGYQTFADAGVVDTNVIRYVIEDGPDWEIGTGTYTASGTTLSRTVTESSNSDSALNLTGFAVVFVGAVVEDLAVLAPLASPALTGTPTTPTATFGTNTTQIATTAFVSTATTSTVAALTPAATVDVSLADDDYFTITLGQDTTFTVSNVEAVDTFNLAVTGADVPGPAYDIANASYDSLSFSVGSQNTSPRTTRFSSDGTKMYMLGGNSIYQYTLSTAGVINTASYDSVSFAVGSQETDANGLTFKDDGSKFYIVGVDNDSVFQYSLSTAWDLSTASYDSVSFSVSAQAILPVDLFLKDDGTKLYILSNDVVFQYTLSTAWVVSSASYDTVNFGVSSQDSDARGFVFSNNGNTMFIAGSTNDSVFQYTLSTAWDLSTAAYDSISFSVTTQDAELSGISFSSTGNQLFALGDTNNSVFQYTTQLIAPATTTFPASFEFTSGATPAAPADGVTDILEAQTTNGGTTWYVTPLGQNVGPAYEEFLTSGTWTKPAGVTWVYVEAIGGGAGGANATDATDRTGGGGGGFNEGLFLASTVGSTETVTIGAGGAGGGNGTFGNGADGGDSSFGSLLSGNGGEGGGGSGAHGGGGEVGGRASDPNGNGGYSSGGGAVGNGSGGSCVKGGGGGGGYFGGGTSQEGGNGGLGNDSAGTAAVAGSAPGGGGGGCTNNGGGGAGAAGRLRVWAW